MASQQEAYPLQTLSLRSVSSMSADLPPDTVIPGDESEAFLSSGAPDPVPSRQSRAESEAPLTTGQHTASPVPSASLRRSSYVIYMVLLYAALATFAWVITCIQVYKPLTVGHYGVKVGGDNGYGWSSGEYIHGLYTRNEQYFRASRVLQAVVGVLTIPLTSAICSKAAVAYVQQRKQSSGFSMRQLMVLADRGWTDPGVMSKVLFDGWKRYGSSFLLAAILLNLLGTSIRWKYEERSEVLILRRSDHLASPTGLFVHEDHPDTDLAE